MESEKMRRSHKLSAIQKMEALTSKRSGADLAREFGVSREAINFLRRTRGVRRPRVRDAALRFEEKYEIISESGCWIWTGAIDNTTGYGKFKLGNSVIGAHRASYILRNGPINDDLLTCHRCDVRCCVNPDHLFLGTVADNLHDMILKGRGVYLRGKDHPKYIHGRYCASPNA